MPRISLIAKGIRKTELKAIGNNLIGIVENVFGLQGKDYVAFTAVDAVHIINEADIQIRVSFTAGEDEYGRDKPFDPSIETKKKLVTEIMIFMKAYIPPSLRVSVWIIPIYGSVFYTS